MTTVTEAALRDLDLAVAREVMGVATDDPPAYSTDAALALSIVDRMAALGYHYQFEGGPDREGRVVHFTFFGPRGFRWPPAPEWPGTLGYTLPIAICRAALHALRRGVERAATRAGH